MKNTSIENKGRTACLKELLGKRYPPVEISHFTHTHTSWTERRLSFWTRIKSFSDCSCSRTWFSGVNGFNVGPAWVGSVVSERHALDLERLMLLVSLDTITPLCVPELTHTADRLILCLSDSAGSPAFTVLERLRCKPWLMILISWLGNSCVPWNTK